MTDPSSSTITVTNPNGSIVTIEVKETGLSAVQLARLVVDGGLSSQGIDLRRLVVTLSEPVDSTSDVAYILGQDPGQMTPGEVLGRAVMEMYGSQRR